MRELADATNFTMAELRALAKAFAEASTAVGKLNVQLFQDLLARFVPAVVATPELLHRVYSMVDVNSDGEVDFREFCTCTLAPPSLVFLAGLLTLPSDLSQQRSPRSCVDHSMTSLSWYVTG